MCNKGGGGYFSILTGNFEVFQYVSFQNYISFFKDFTELQNKNKMKKLSCSFIFKQ